MTSIVILRGMCSTLEGPCCMFSANRVVRAAKVVTSWKSRGEGNCCRSVVRGIWQAQYFGHFTLHTLFSSILIYSLHISTHFTLYTVYTPHFTILHNPYFTPYTLPHMPHIRPWATPLRGRRQRPQRPGSSVAKISSWNLLGYDGFFDSYSSYSVKRAVKICKPLSLIIHICWLIISLGGFYSSIYREN